MTTANQAPQDSKKLIELVRKNRVIFNGVTYEALPIFAAICNSTVFEIPLKDIVTEDTDKMFVPATQPNRDLFDKEDVAVTMYESRYYVLSGLPQVKAAIAAGEETINARRITNMVLKRARFVAPTSFEQRTTTNTTGAYNKNYSTPTSNKYPSQENRSNRNTNPDNRYNSDYKPGNKFSKRT